MTDEMTSDGAPDLNPRDLEVLRLIGDEDLFGFSFEGLKRRLGTHPETLSRVLGRLESERILQRTGRGYRVTDRGKGFFGPKQLSVSEPRVTLLRTLMPHVENLRETLVGLRGRWFGSLRWLGYSEDEGVVDMKWITEDGGVQIDAIFSEGELVIEGRIREGTKLTEAVKVSHQLVGYISKLFDAQRAGARLAFPVSYDAGFVQN